MNYFQGKNGPYLIAEIGGNHEGNFDYAKKLTYLAANSGVDAIKYQIYSGDKLVNKKIDPERNNHFKKFELTKEEYIELANICKSLNVSFMASVWDLDAINYIEPYMPIYKVGSGDMNNFLLIKSILEIGKPLIISTGLANIKEVKKLYKFISENFNLYIRNKKVSFLQCTSMYPIPDSEANLNVISSYKKNFNIPIGYSDHTIGSYALEIASAMDAEILEFHFTDNRNNKTFRDHKVSLTCDEVISLIKKIKLINNLKGSFIKNPTTSEIETDHINSFRRSLYTKSTIKKGDVIKEKDLISLRPKVDDSIEKFSYYIGKKAPYDIPTLSPLGQHFIDK